MRSCFHSKPRVTGERCRDWQLNLVTPEKAGVQSFLWIVLDSGPGLRRAGVTFLRRNDDGPG